MSKKILIFFYFRILSNLALKVWLRVDERGRPVLSSVLKEWAEGCLTMAVIEDLVLSSSWLRTLLLSRRAVASMGLFVYELLSRWMMQTGDLDNK